MTLFDSKECCICLQELLETDKVCLDCGHAFHFSCLMKNTGNKRCPLCRKEYIKEENIYKTFVDLLVEIEDSDTINNERDLLESIDTFDRSLQILESKIITGKCAYILSSMLFPKILAVSRGTNNGTIHSSNHCIKILRTQYQRIIDYRRS
jgi:Ring finger domain